MRFSIISLGALALASAAPAFAQDETDPPPAIKLTGQITLASEYRFRGLTQTDEEPAVQATVNINHESGFYVGVWASNIDGSAAGTTPLLTNYGDAEVDLYGGFTKTFDNGVGVDIGLLYYYYTDAADGLNTDFFEPYASVSYTLGPVLAKLGGAYAFGGQDGLDFTASNDDNIYVYGDLAIGVPTTPITLKGHVGYTDGSLGLANLVASDQTYLDWSVGLEGVGGPFKVGATYVDTDIDNNRDFAGRLGRESTVIGYVAYAF